MSSLSWLKDMLLPKAMGRVGLFFLAEEAPRVVSVLARHGGFHVERIPSDLEDYVESIFPPRYREAHRRLRQCMEALTHRWPARGLEDAVALPREVPRVEELETMVTRLEEVLAQIEELGQRERQLRTRRLEMDHYLDYVRALAELGVDAGALSDLRFLHLRAGTVPTENVDRLRQSAHLGEDLVLDLGRLGDRNHVLVIGRGGVSADLDGLLAKAHFEPHPVAGFEGGGSVALSSRLESARSSLEVELLEVDRGNEALLVGNRELIAQGAALSARAGVFTACDGALEGHGAIGFLNGWVPRDRLAELSRSLAVDVPGPVAVVRHSPIEHAMDATPPTDILAPRVLDPGLELVSLYGLPGYRELNPTLLIAFLTPLFFGMMFGDIGHGLLLLVACFLLRGRLGPRAVVGFSCGAGAVVFGFLYGSFLGIEGLVPALWLHPMEEPFRILTVSLWMGVTFVLSTFLLKMANLLLRHEWSEAVLGIQGLSGSVLYLGLVGTTCDLAMGEAPALSSTLFAGLGGLLAATFAVVEVCRKGTEVLADLLSEYFHTLLSFLTNTLSFLRLAAFALAHSALSMATFLMMEAVPGGFCQGMVFLAGTTVILVLDGLAVVIQAVRLQFYEGLSRYYKGDGRTYRPLRFEESVCNS